MKSGCYGDSRLGECQCPWSLTYAPEYLLILPSAPFSSGRFISAFPVPHGKAKELFCSFSARLGIDPADNNAGLNSVKERGKEGRKFALE